MTKRDSRPKAAHVLAALTSKDEAEFEPDLEKYPYPDVEDLESVPADEFYDGG